MAGLSFRSFLLATTFAACTLTHVVVGAITSSWVVGHNFDGRCDIPNIIETHIIPHGRQSSSSLSIRALPAHCYQPGGGAGAPEVAIAQQAPRPILHEEDVGLSDEQVVVLLNNHLAEEACQMVLVEKEKDAKPKCVVYYRDASSGFSKYGKGVLNALWQEQTFRASLGQNWAPASTGLPVNWLVATPAGQFGKSTTDLVVAPVCEKDHDNEYPSGECDTKFRLYKCDPGADGTACPLRPEGPIEIPDRGYFSRGVCKVLQV